MPSKANFAKPKRKPMIDRLKDQEQSMEPEHLENNIRDFTYDKDPFGKMKFGMQSLHNKRKGKLDEYQNVRPTARPRDAAMRERTKYAK